MVPSLYPSSTNWGKSSRIFNDTIVIGGPTDNIVDIFMKDSSNNWNYIQSLLASSVSGINNPSNCEFGYSLAIYENILAIGAPSEDSNGTDTGAVIIYEKSLTTGLFVFVEILRDDTPVNNDRCGSSVALGANILAVGCYGTDSDIGSMIIYYRNSGFYNESIEVFPSDGMAGDKFGFSSYGKSITISEPYIVVGVQNSRKTYIFESISTMIVDEIQIITDPAASISSLFGTSVSIDSNPFYNLVVGASGDNLIYVYTKVNDTFNQWQLFQTIISPIALGSGIDFGTDVSIYENTYLVVGSPGFNNDTGVLVVYAKSNITTWLEQTTLSPESTSGFSNLTMGSVFGRSVDLYCNNIIGTAMLQDVDGFAYVFSNFDLNPGTDFKGFISQNADSNSNVFIQVFCQGILFPCPEDVTITITLRIENIPDIESDFFIDNLPITQITTTSASNEQFENQPNFFNAQYDDSGNIKIFQIQASHISIQTTIFITLSFVGLPP